MREIKFRVFDKAHGSTHVVGSEHHDSFTCYDEKFEYQNLQNGESSAEYSDYILMQYTGLKDKNGVEIYEGDIVQIYPKQGYGYLTMASKLGVIEYVSGSYMVSGNDGGTPYFLIYVEVEVAGNIHEHKHLLEGESIEAN